MFSVAGKGTQLEALFVFGTVAVFIVTMFLSLVMLLTKQYRRCPPNQLLVIFGKTPGQPDQSCKVFHGGAVFIWPLLQDYAYLSLERMQIEVPKTLRGLAFDRSLKLPETWSFAIGVTPELTQHAAIRLLGLSPQEIERIATDLIVGRLQKHVESLESTPAPADSASIIDKWKSEIDRDLSQVGLVTIGYR